MSDPELILEFSEFDPDRILFDQEAIRQYNAHRFEVEQLTAIVFEDSDRQISVGYRDVVEDEFWARGHFPGRPMLPSVLLCESAAQLCCFHVQRAQLAESDMLGFAALDDVEFGPPVFPGQRVVVVGRAARIRRGVLVMWQFQQFVDGRLVCHGVLKGVPLKREWLTRSL